MRFIGHEKFMVNLQEDKQQYIMFEGITSHNVARQHPT